MRRHRTSEQTLQVTKNGDFALLQFELVRDQEALGKDAADTD